MNIVVPPTTLPRVEGMKARYRVGDTLKATCTSKNSKPAANLTWGLNGNILDSEYIKKFSVKIEPETNLETATSTLSLELQRHHFSASGRLKLKCTASIHNIYWRTSENSAEEERPKAAVVAAQDYRLHDVFRKPIDFFYTTPAPSNCAASSNLNILPISSCLIKNAVSLSLFLFNYCYFY